jgi:hypothetical protein
MSNPHFAVFLLPPVWFEISPQLMRTPGNSTAGANVNKSLQTKRPLSFGRVRKIV